MPNRSWTVGLLLVGLSLPVGVFAQVRILDADYGTRGRACDATYAVANRCDGVRECEIVASNHLCGDPFQGKKKTLTIRYRCPGGEFVAEAVEDESAVLRCHGRNARAVGRHHGGYLYVELAEYIAGRKACDATRALQRACNGSDACSVSVDNGLCGDPFKGKKKHLEISYDCGGRRFTDIFEEGRVARLECR